MVDIRNVYVDPRMVDFNESKDGWVIHSTQRELGYILEQHNNGIYKDLRSIDIANLKYDEWINSAITEEERQQRRASIGLGLPLAVEHKLEINIIFWNFGAKSLVTGWKMAAMNGHIV